jgi:hypothetical protein
MTMMKKLFVFVLVVFLPVVVWADPRMETADNFCHFIHNNTNADDESFVADCGSQISVNDTTGVAQGFAYVVRDHVPVGFDEVTTLFRRGRNKSGVVITSEDYPDVACALVDSNGTQYNSNNWVNRISFKARRGRHVGTVVYQLHCIDARVPQ